MWKLLVVFSTVVLIACADGESPTTSELTFGCGPVTFESVPPGLDEFPPLDADAQSALDELVNGPRRNEVVGFDQNYQWSIASRTNERLELIGHGKTPEAGWVNVEFVRENGEWTPTTVSSCYPS